MVESIVSTTRLDPYKAFKFRVRFDGRYVAGVRTVVGVGVGVGADVGLPANRTEYEAVTLERGVTHDAGFEHWVTASSAAMPAGAVGSLTDPRQDITLEEYDEAGTLVMTYQLYRCWVSEYQALPNLDGNANDVAIDRIKLEHEGWEPDVSVLEPPSA